MAIPPGMMRPRKKQAAFPMIGEEGEVRLSGKEWIRRPEYGAEGVHTFRHFISKRVMYGMLPNIRGCVCLCTGISWGSDWRSPQSRPAPPSDKWSGPLIRGGKGWLSRYREEKGG